MNGPCRYRRRMPEIALATVPASRRATCTVIGYASFPERTPFSVGTGDTDYVCGHCAFVLIKSATEVQTATGLAIRCPSCGSYNDLSGGA